MSLSDKELQALAEKLAPMVGGKSEQPKEQPKKTDAPQGDNSDLASQIADIIEQKSKTANNEVYETLWQDKLSSMFKQTQGLKDFMEEEDDYGVVRIERLKDMPFEDRVKTAEKLEEQYRKAVSNTGNSTPRISAKTQELAESNEKQYNEVEEKLRKNEYSSVDELRTDFFDALSNEMDSVLGN